MALYGCSEPSQQRVNFVNFHDRGGRFTWSPGQEKLPTAPGGSWRKDGPGWVKCRAYISQRAHACVCVCVCVSCVASIKYTCVLLVAIKELTEVSLVCLFV